jgi:predicted MFS family arabinose efflux permease
LAAEGLGIIVLAPLLIKVSGIPAVGLGGALLCFLAGFIVFGLPKPFTTDHPTPTTSKTWSQFWQDVRTGWQTIVRDPVLRIVALQATVAAAILLVLVSLLPGLVSRHFELGAEDVPLFVLPAGLGFVIGSILISRTETRIRRRAWIAPGLMGSGLSTGSLALFGSSPEHLLLAVLILFCLGFCLALVIIPARTVLQEHPPAGLRGRVISAQLAMSNAAAILPLVLGGSLADQFGILPVMGGLGLICVLASLPGLHQALSRS